MIRLCFHGAESTGKSVLSAKLSDELGIPLVGEYGREYAERHGTEFTMADLLAIAEGHEARVRAVEHTGAPLCLLDTDPLMTAAWAEMLFATVPDRLLAYPKADLYLLFDPDVPWIADGTRFFGTAESRARFAAVAQRILDDAQVPYRIISGTWLAREASARQAIADLTALADEV